MILAIKGAFGVASGGGGGTTDAPSNYSGLSAWYRSTDLVLSDGNPIGTWSDQSGNANHATASGTARPTYKTAIIGSIPVVRFDGSSDVMNLSSALSLGTSLTIIALLKISAGGDYGGSSGGHRVAFFATPTNKALFYDTVDPGDFSDTFGGADTDFKMVTIRKNGSNTIYRENKTARGTHGIGAVGFNFDRVGGNGAFGGQFYSGDMVEMAIWSNPLTDGNLDSLYDNYFKVLYTTLP